MTAREWGAMTWLHGIVILIALGFGAMGNYHLALAVLGGGALVAVLLSQFQGALSHWGISGLIYIAVPMLVFLWLRAESDRGAEALFWLFGVVWLTDSAAYVVGTSLRGPRLAPNISPKKTWSGLVGGVGGGALAGLLLGGPVFSGTEYGSTGMLLLISAALSLSAQGGDLVESALKRHFGIKDSGNLIPGHGGILDRMDSLVIGSLVAASLVAAGGA